MANPGVPYVRQLEVAVAYARGDAIAEIASKYGLCKHTIVDIATRFGINRRPRLVRVEPPGTREWKDIPGFAGVYQVSNDGLVRRVLPTQRYLRGTHGPHGYYAVTLSSGGKRHRWQIHRLVARTFHGPEPFPGAVVRHLNDVRTDNRVENLAWGTHKDNSADSIRNGCTRRGERVPWAKMTDSDARRIWTLRAEGKSIRDVARIVQITENMVRSVLHGSRWRSILVDERTKAMAERARLVTIPRGENRYNAVLTEKAVVDIRENCSGWKADLDRFAAKYSTSAAAVKSALVGLSWKHLATAPQKGPGNVRGSSVPASRLTEDSVAEIKVHLASGEAQSAVASSYGVSPATIGSIARGTAWRHVQGPPIKRDKRRQDGEYNSAAKMNTDKVIDVRKRAESGENYGRLASDFGVSRACISLIVARKTWGGIP